MQTRHTFATLMIDAGEDIGWVQRMMGHSSLQMIYTKYYSLGRWDPHYYTSLYAAFHFFLHDDLEDIVAGRMAVDQAIRYFAAGIGKAH